MEQEIPRRLRRFYREDGSQEKPTEQQVKERSTEIALRHVDEFHKVHSRYPKKDELEEVSQNVFEQLKKELESGPESSEIDLGKLKEEKTLLEQRKERRGRHAHEAAKGQKAQKQAAAENEGGKKRDNKIEGESDSIIEDEKDDGQDEAAEESETEESETDENVEDVKISEIPQDELAGLGEGESGNARQITQMDELSSLEDELSGSDDSDMVEKEMESEINKCPRCATTTKEFIYCPSCGDAFCNHCAKAVEPQAQSVRYTCPSCGNMFRKAR